jgi:hypothetical protein
VKLKKVTHDFGSKISRPLICQCGNWGTVSETSIEVRRLEWAGHLERMSDDRIVKKVCVGKPDGKK